MGRTRRVAIDQGIEVSGNDWDDRGDSFPFPQEGYVEFFLPFSISLGGNGNNFVNSVTLWANGVLSLGPPTQAQIDFFQTSASPIPGEGNAGFPGFFFLFDYTGVNQNSYSYGIGRADYFAPFSSFDAVDAAFFSLNDAFGGYQIVLDASGFSILSEDDFSVPNAINGYFIGGQQFQVDSEPIEFDFYPDFLTYAGTPDPDTVTGSEFNEVFLSSASGDTIDGLDGIDLVSYANSAAGIIVNLTSGSFAGGDARDDLLLGIEDIIGSAHADRIAGNDQDNRLSGLAGDDIIGGQGGFDYIEGGAGADTLGGGLGFDILSYIGSPAGVTVSLRDGTADGGDATGDTFAGFEAIDGSNFDDVLTASAAGSLLLGEDGNDTLIGLGGADSLHGGFGDDFLVGGAGADTINGGLGDNDTVSYFSSPAGVTLDFRFSLQSGGDAQGDILSVFDIEHVIGSAFADSIIANSSNNRLEGGDGADTLFGRFGDDVLLGGAGADMLYGEFDDDTLLGGDGDDLLDGDTGLDVLDGGSGSDTLLGGAGNDLLTGGEGNDSLDGGTGADFMNGGAGDDTYYLDSPADIVSEQPVNGTDKVIATISYVLPAEVERLVLSGNSAINGTGNALANVISGNNMANVLKGGAGNDTLAGGSGNDTLDGEAGADAMYGGLGDDTYFVDNAGDFVFEAVNSGTDKAVSTISYVLPTDVERLVLSGNSPINGTGNALANVISGNNMANVLKGGAGNDTLAGGSGNDTLDGEAGADAMYGGLGDDTYFVDNAGDFVFEDLNSGTDKVVSTITYQLPSNVENLVLSGSAPIGGVGNSLANTISGNAAGNSLLGGAGNDTLAGGGGNDALAGGVGNDKLYGGTGSDVFRFDAPLGPDNVDTIFDYSVADDVIHLDDAMFAGLSLGALAAGAFNTGTTASDADDRIIYDPVTGALLFDADGNGAGAAIQFATLTPGLAMTAGEFFVI